MKEFINKFVNYCNNITDSIRHDLLLHAFVSLIIYILTFNVLSLFCDRTDASMYAIGLTLFIGFFKEFIIDLVVRKMYADIDDIYADIIGILIGVVITLPLFFEF